MIILLDYHSYSVLVFGLGSYPNYTKPHGCGSEA